MQLGLLVSEIFRLTAKYMTSTTKTRKKYLALVVGAAVAVGVLLLAAAGTLSISSAQSQEQVQAQQQPNSTGQNGTTTAVAAGGGGPESVLIAFVPKNITINTGQTVVWTNPTLVGEPHTVSFIRQEGYFANFESPFLIANGTDLTPANPDEQNTEPLIIPGQNDTANKVVVAANARSTNPVVIDAQNNVKYLQPNANYTMTGDELYVNSGWMWPEGQAPPGAPPIKSFSITFEKAGTYDYICEVHPWMIGQVVVQ
jgi:plastocyanin